MKEKKSPAFQLYPDKALAGSDHLTPVAFKAYWKILWWMWLHGPGHCKMPNTPKAWTNATGIRGKPLVKAQGEILNPDHTLLRKRILKGRDFLLSLGLQKEAKKQRHWSKKSSIGGKTSASVRKQKKLELSDEVTVVEPPLQPTGQPKGNTPSPSPSPSPSPPSEGTSQKKKRKSFAYSEEFERLWKELPKGPKKEASEEFQILPTDAPTLDKLVEILQAQKTYKREMEGFGEPQADFKDLVRWLRDQRWDDVIPKEEGYNEPPAI